VTSAMINDLAMGVKISDLAGDLLIWSWPLPLNKLIANVVESSTQ
jgi:hypothetical protein